MLKLPFSGQYQIISHVKLMYLVSDPFFCLDTSPGLT
uniref:Uncharacterized protein n=1 Tax=Arundo donax TaxID=35708 RepID=A0A0A9H7V5_ARUDO